MTINELPICIAAMVRVEQYRYEEKNKNLFEGYFDNMPKELGGLEVISMNGDVDSMTKHFNVIVVLVK